MAQRDFGPRVQRPPRDHETEKGSRAKLGTAPREGRAREVAFRSRLHSQRSVKGQRSGLELSPWKDPLLWLWLPHRETFFPLVLVCVLQSPSSFQSVVLGIPHILAQPPNSIAIVCLPIQILAEGLLSPVVLDRYRQGMVERGRRKSSCPSEELLNLLGPEGQFTEVTWAFSPGRSLQWCPCRPGSGVCLHTHATM